MTHRRSLTPHQQNITQLLGGAWGRRGGWAVRFARMPFECPSNDIPPFSQCTVRPPQRNPHQLFLVVAQILLGDQRNLTGHCDRGHNQDAGGRIPRPDPEMIAPSGRSPNFPSVPTQPTHFESIPTRTIHSPSVLTQPSFSNQTSPLNEQQNWMSLVRFK